MSESPGGQVDAPVSLPPDGNGTPTVPDEDETGADGSGGAETDHPVPAGVTEPGAPVVEAGPAGPIGTDHDLPAPSAAMPPMGDYRMALVASINVDLPNQHPTVVLRETESPRRQLSFSVGFQDAVVLSHAMRRIPTPRPLTPELMSQALQGFDIDVVAVRMVGRQGAVYFAELDLRGRTGRTVLSCRPSDGLTVALLQPVSVPILIDRRLLELDGDVVPPGPGPTVA